MVWFLVFIKVVVDTVEVGAWSICKVLWLGLVVFVGSSVVLQNALLSQMSSLFLSVILSSK